jgi:hypothetical protein
LGHAFEPLPLCFNLGSRFIKLLLSLQKLGRVCSVVENLLGFDTQILGYAFELLALGCNLGLGLF